MKPTFSVRDIALLLSRFRRQMLSSRLQKQFSFKQGVFSIVLLFIVSSITLTYIIVYISPIEEDTTLLLKPIAIALACTAIIATTIFSGVFYVLQKAMRTLQSNRTHQEQALSRKLFLYTSLRRGSIFGMAITLMLIFEMLQINSTLNTTLILLIGLMTELLFWKNAR